MAKRKKEPDFSKDENTEPTTESERTKKANVPNFVTERRIEDLTRLAAAIILEEWNKHPVTKSFVGNINNMIESVVMYFTTKVSNNEEIVKEDNKKLIVKETLEGILDGLDNLTVECVIQTIMEAEERDYEEGGKLYPMPSPEWGNRRSDWIAKAREIIEQEGIEQIATDVLW